MFISAEELKQKLLSNEDFVLLDVRSQEEYDSWNIEGSVNMPMQELPMRMQELPENKEIVTLCAHDPRSQHISQILAAQGFNAKFVQGGMAAWNSVYDLAPLIEKSDFTLHQIKRIGKGCLGYFLVSKGEAAVIDPTTHTQEYRNLAKQLNCEIKFILDTHQHADHISGAKMLQKATGASFLLNSKDGYGFSGFKELNDKDNVNVGDVSINILHTPGHTPGSTCFVIEDKFLLTGDTLFIDGVARPDLKDKAEEYAGVLYKTYQDRILNLPESIGVASAHSRPELNFGRPLFKTLDWIKKNNRVFELSKSEFVDFVTSNIPPKPFNHESIVNVNKNAMDLDEEDISELEFGANRCVLRT